MNEPLSIKLFLTKGSASSLRTAEISNWSGKAIACSRTELDELSKREEAIRPGVYFLIGNDIETGEPSVYVGETEELFNRLKKHLPKEFWNQAVGFVSKDENLTKAHIKYLEGKLIEIGNKAGKGIIQNNQSSGAKLPESDQAEMDIFLDKILKLLPVLGTSLFSIPEVSTKKVDDRLICKIKGLTAYGNRTDNGFIVYKDSEAVPEDRPSATRGRVRRKLLVDKGILVKQNDRFVFSRDHEFTSPSLAAAAVRGGASNGLTAWKTKSGKSLKELELSDQDNN
ncbi:MAG: GIY-YIG nuclease family protein [Gammaproteobacteria bacterium]|nr:GIY-YIG nuclease family protein [Gammaproteobacteria bacterium]